MPTPDLTPPVNNDAVAKDTNVVVNAAALVRVYYKPGSPDAMPCNWELKAVEGSEDQIIGVNTATGSTFEGTRADFSEAIRGE